MATGKEIKVVLSLDDSGFSVKTKTAREATQALNAGFETIGKTVGSLEGSIGKLAKSTDAIPAAFQGIQKTLQAVASTMEAAVNKMAAVAASSRAMRAEAVSLDTGLQPLSKTLGGISKANTALAVSMAQMKPSLAAAAAGFKDLDTAATTSAKIAKETATSSIDARLKVLASEIKTNDEIIANREKQAKILAEVDRQQSAMSMARAIEADNFRRTKKAGSTALANAKQGEADGFSNGALVARNEVAALDALIPKMQQEQAERRANVASIEQERKAVLADVEAKKVRADIALYVGKKNAAELDRITKDSRALQREGQRQAAADARTSADQQIAYAREVADAHKAQANAIGSMWKAMAQGYAAMKIERGIGASVAAGSSMQQEKILVGALNLPKGEEDGLFASAAQMANQLKFISNLDAIKARMSGIASIGSNNAAVLDATLPKIVMAQNNLANLGLAAGDAQTTIRNLYGVIEMRGQANAPDAANRTTDIMQKIITGTSGKVETADMETVLRRAGAGASQMSDEGMVHLAAIVDQFKVAGGDHGGGGGGVSTVGTMIKMFQAYAMGKTLSDSAVKEFSGAGILDESGLDMSKDKAGAFKDAKHAGLKNADLWMKDPAMAMRALMPDIIKYTQEAKNQKQFYQGKDMADPENQMTAVMKYLQRLGITQTAVSAMVTVGDPRNAQRMDQQSGTISGSKGVEALNAAQAATYSQTVNTVKAQLTDIATLVGTTLLPILTSVLTVVSDILGAFKGFATENPLSTAFLAISATVGGALLGVKSFMGMFGMEGGLTGLLARFGTMAGALFPSVVGWFGSLAALMPGMGSFLGFLVSKLSAFGLLWMSFDIGYIIGGWVRTINVGGLQIGQQFENMFNTVTGWWDKTIIGLQRRWAEFKNALGITSDAEFKAENALLDAKAKHQQQISDMSRQTASDSLTGARPGMNDPRIAAMQESIANDKKISAMLGTGGNPGAFGDGAPAKAKRPTDQDPLNKALQDAEGRLNSQKIKLKSLVVGTEELSDLRAEAVAEVEGHRLADDYSKDHSPSKRPAANSDKIQKLVEVTYQQKLGVEQTKALQFANERLAAAQLEAGDAMDRLTGDNATKQTDAFRALARELARAEERLGAGAKGFDKWALARDKALFERTRADLGNQSSTQLEQNRTDAVAFLPTASARATSGLDTADKKQNDLYKSLIDNMEKYRAVTIADYQASAAASILAGADRVTTELTTAEKIAAVNKEANAALLDAGKIQTEALLLQAEKRRRALEDPIVGLARTWKDTDAEINGMQNKWADGFVSMLTSTLGTGKMKVADYAKSILTDILSVQMKSTLADPMKNIIGAGTDWLKSNLFPGGAAQKSMENVGSAGNIKALERAAEQAGGSLADMAKGGVTDAAAATAKEALQSAQGSSVAQVFTGALEQATSALAGFIATLQAGGGSSGGGGSFLSSLFGGGTGVGSMGATTGMGEAGMFAVGFANGGIMTNHGSMELRKYASGGIANSPQLAMYGEAGPEAYVPLPDGRSIPVTMQGGGSGAAPAVTVNVINQSGMAVSAQQGQPKFDGKSMILDVVLSAANTPGGFRDGMKGALK